MRYLLLALALLLPQIAAAEDVCARPDLIAMKFLSCKTVPFDYVVDSQKTKGQLITLDLGNNRAECHFPCDVILENTHYFLQTDAGKMIDLKDFPQEANDNRASYGATACLADMLEGVSPSDVPESREAWNDFSRYPAAHIVEPHYELQGNQLIAKYEGRYPFEGSAQTLDGRICMGNLHLKKEFIGWYDAAKLCDASFHQQFTPDEPERIKPARAMMHEDAAGHYYICNIFWEKPGSHWKLWHYRVDMDTNNTKPVYLNSDMP